MQARPWRGGGAGSGIGRLARPWKPLRDGEPEGGRGAATVAVGQGRGRQPRQGALRYRGHGLHPRQGEGAGTRCHGVTAINAIRVLPSFEIIDGLNGKNGRSIGNMHQIILGRLLTEAHCAGTDVDGLINILCDKRITKKMMKDATKFPLSLWLERSNHSKTRLDWEKKMQVEMEAENSTPFRQAWLLLQVGNVATATTM